VGRVPTVFPKNHEGSYLEEIDVSLEEFQQVAQKHCKGSYLEKVDILSEEFRQVVQKIIRELRLRK
jgi:hypothetical protein